MDQSADAPEGRSLDQLFADLGTAVAHSQFGASHEAPADTGRAWLATHRAVQKAKICPHRHQLSSSFAEATSAVADLILGITVGIPPVTVARVVAKLGVDQFCADDEASV